MRKHATYSHTHTYSHTCTHKHSVMSTLLQLETWLSWISPCSPFLFSICLSVGEPVWGKMMPTVQMPCLTFFTLTVSLHCSFTPLIPEVVFFFAISNFFSTQPPHPHGFIYFRHCSASPCIPLSFLWFCTIDQKPGRDKCRSAGQISLPLCPNYMGQSQLPCGQPKHFLG